MPTSPRRSRFRAAWCYGRGVWRFWRSDLLFLVHSATLALLAWAVCQWARSLGSPSDLALP